MEDRFEIFTRTISRLYRNIQRIKSVEMDSLGLRGTQTMCLYYLGLSPQGLTAAQLCEQCGEDRAAVSRTLAQLEKNGFLHCETPVGKRKYRSVITLTYAGQKAANALQLCVSRALAEGGDGLTDKERAQFYDTLERIDDNLQAICEQKTHRQEEKI